MSAIELLGLGAVAIDHLIYINAFPRPDQRTRVIRQEQQCGGLTATALVAAARLGVRCAYAGVLGEDELSHAAVRCLQNEGINLDYLARLPDARPVNSTIIIDQTHGTRNIFCDMNGVIGAAQDWPPEEIIRSSAVLFVDAVGLPGMIRAARIARQAGIPVVADVETDSPLFPELLAEIDHLILSWGFAQRVSGAETPAIAATHFWTANRQVVVITCGADGCWYLAGQGLAIHIPAYPVEVVDTTGCGDIFHGAYAAGLIKGLDLAERLRYASAAAAIKAMTCGGQAGAPTRQALEAFIKARN